MRVTYEKDRSHRPAYLKTTMALYPFDLGDLLVGALLEELMEPLDLMDIEEEQRARIRESF